MLIFSKAVSFLIFFSSKDRLVFPSFVTARCLSDSYHQVMEALVLAAQEDRYGPLFGKQGSSFGSQAPFEGNLITASISLVFCACSSGF